MFDLFSELSILEEGNEEKYDVRRISKRKESLAEILQKGFSLKDTLVVPIHGKSVEFVVEHIRNIDDETDKVYFVAKNIFIRNRMNLEEINGLLDGIESGMPRELVEQLADFEHITNKGFEMTRRVNLLSLGNFQDTEGYCIGKDDVIFDGFRTEAERAKNFEGESRAYWICTPWKGERSPNVSFSTNFYYVYANGYLSYYNYASGISGVVPGFSICIPHGTD